MLVVGPAKCEPRDIFRCKGLPGLGGDLATSDDRDEKMSVGLAPASGGSCNTSSAFAGGVRVLLRPAVCIIELLALVGLELPPDDNCGLTILTKPLLFCLPLTGLDMPAALPGGDG